MAARRRVRSAIRLLRSRARGKSAVCGSLSLGRARSGRIGTRYGAMLLVWTRHRPRSGHRGARAHAPARRSRRGRAPGPESGRCGPWRAGQRSHLNPGVVCMLNVRLDLPVAIVTIDRPQRRNALAGELVAKLDVALRELDRNGDVRAIVLQGSPPGFCAGSDLRELAAMSLHEMCDHEADTARFARSIPQF